MNQGWQFICKLRARVSHHLFFLEEPCSAVMCNLLTCGVDGSAEYAVTDSGKFAFVYDFNMCAQIPASLSSAQCQSNSGMICQVLYR